MAGRQAEKRGSGEAPLVAHLIHRLAVGGLENGLVNLINLTPPERYRHAVICMTEYTEFRDRICRPDVPVWALHKREGQDPAAYVRLWKLLRRLRPQILHTRTFGVLDGQICAALAGVPGRVHGEHGRSDDRSRFQRYRRRFLRTSVDPLVHHYTAVSHDLASWLVEAAGVSEDRVTLIYNGVDMNRFSPGGTSRAALLPPGFPEGALVIGTVGRMQPVKDQLTLARALLHLLESVPDARHRIRLVMAGDGPLRRQVQDLLGAAGALDLAWLPGERSDIPQIMRALDVFVLPSLSEGTSNTILEAMASGLPVVATRVGGNPELVSEGTTGFLTPPDDPAAMSAALRRYLENPALRLDHGHAARAAVKTRFSLEAMLGGYLGVYDAVLQRTGTRGSLVEGAKQ